MAFSTNHSYHASSPTRAQVRTAKIAIHWGHLPTRLNIPGATELEVLDASVAVARNVVSHPNCLTNWTHGVGTVNIASLVGNNLCSSSKGGIVKFKSLSDNQVEQPVATMDHATSSPEEENNSSRVEDVNIPHNASDPGTNERKSSTSPIPHIATLEEEVVAPNHYATSSVNLHSEEEPAPMVNKIWKRESKKYWNAEGETTWFGSASGHERRTLPIAASLPGLCAGDIFIHTVMVNEEKPYHQLWLRGDVSWQPVIEGHQISDISGKTRILVVNSDHEPSWVLRSTAQRNYNPKKKTRTSKR